MNVENNNNEATTTPVATEQEQISKKTRHWFVTFWLYSIIVVGFAGIVIIPDIMVFLNGVTSIISAIMLLKWKKNGFVLWCASAIVLVLLDIANKGLAGLAIDFNTLLLALISTVVLFAILQIKKNGISTWKQLS